MSPRTTAMNEALAAYVVEHGLREHPCLRALRQETDGHLHGSMRSSAEQVALLGFLIELIGARHVLEVGCFTGYGTLGMALALPKDGRIVSLDVNQDWADIGRRHWRAAGVESRIDFRCVTALAGMDRLAADQETFDLVYIDADKKTYPDYYRRALTLTRPGGLIALDNMLRGGGVADPGDQSRQTVAIRALTDAIHADAGVSMCLAPLGDGLMLVRRRA